MPSNLNTSDITDSQDVSLYPTDLFTPETETPKEEELTPEDVIRELDEEKLLQECLLDQTSMSGKHLNQVLQAFINGSIDK